MSPGWTVVLLVGVGTALLKAAGPMILGVCTPSARVQSVLARLAPAMFGALIATNTFASGRRLTVDPRLVALVLGVVGAWWRVPAVVVLALAVVAVAVIRRLT